MQLVCKISNLCDPDPPTSQTDRQTDRQTDGRTTCNLNTALCTSASRSKNPKMTVNALHIYLKNNPIKFNPALNAAIHFFEEVTNKKNKKKNNKMSSDMRSVPDPITLCKIHHLFWTHCHITENLLSFSTLLSVFWKTSRWQCLHWLRTLDLVSAIKCL